MLLYVDDIIITGNCEKDLREIKANLMNEFSMKDLGKLDNFLGIKIERTNEGMFLSQTVYMKNLLTRFNMDECKASKTPMEVTSWKEQDNRENLNCIIEKKPYRELVGCLMHLMLTTRQDLSASVNYLIRFQTNATDLHWNGLKRILRYVKGTLDYGLFYQRSKSSNVTLLGYADADWAGDTDRKSTSRFLIQVCNATIVYVLWATRKQTAVALSSIEAEYVALASAATELI